MASQPPEGPEPQEREFPGDTAPNPSGVSTETPAEGDDDEPEPDDGSPEA